MFMDLNRYAQTDCSCSRNVHGFEPRAAGFEGGKARVSLHEAGAFEFHFGHGWSQSHPPTLRRNG